MNSGRRLKAGITLLLVLLLSTAASSVPGADSPPVDSRYYSVVVDGDPVLAKRIGEALDVMLEEGYCDLLKRPPPRNRRFRVRVLEDREKYLAYCREKEGKDSEHPSFVYIHFARDHVDNEVLGYRMAESPLFGRLYHEGWHQYFRNAVNGPPQWLNEGFAEYFEGFAVDNEGKVIPGMSRGMMRRLREGVYDWDEGPLNEVYGPCSVSDACSVEQAEFYRNPANFAVAFALCFWLVEGDDRDCRGLLARLGRALRPDASQAENTERVLAVLRGRIGLDALDEKLSAWFRDRRVAGDEELQAAIRDLVARRMEEAEKGFRRVTEIAPDWERGWFYLGQVLFARGRFEDAAASLRRATDLFPEYAPAQEYLAMSAEKLGLHDEAVLAARRAMAQDERCREKMETLIRRVEAARGGD